MNFLKSIFGRKKEEIQNLTSQKELQTINIEEEFQKIMNVLDKYKRTAYIPIVKESELEFSAKSKFGGFPYLRNQYDWPICPNCSKNMQLFLQLNLEDLPIKKDKGLIQLFYCTTAKPPCESDLEAFFPFSKAVESRKIQIEENTSSIIPEIDEIYQEKLIIGWDMQSDYPHPEEFHILGIDLDFEDGVYELMEEREIGLTLQGDKLFGWPYWVQSEEYPFDRNTGTRMELLFQLSSEDNLPYMFGDVGIGHLTQSIDNQNELGFGWACS